MHTTVQSSFNNLGLSEAILRDIAKTGFTEPTPIQAQAIPPGLEGRDVLGCAQTGPGKTAAFAIPMVERLAAGPKGHPRALILAPTRELAIQIQETIDKLGRSQRIFATTVVGGADMNAQIRGLRQRPDIIVATPGRLLDHMWNGTISLLKMQILVLDEADRMLDMGFAPQINQILEALPEERQTLLFSATIPTNVADLVRASVKDPVRVTIGKSATAADRAEQALHHTTREDKTKLLLSLLDADRDSVLVFTRTKHGADRLGRALGSAGHKVATIHGDRSLSQRRAALEGFRRGTFRVLVATDVAARGIDVANIGHVVNYDMPNSPEDYIHRIGRTARVKASGRATSFITSEDHIGLRAIEKLLGQPIPRAAGSAAPAHSASPMHNPRHNGQRDARPGQPSGFRPRRPAHARQSHGA
ncbi:MAG: DEAD/DEAH box helicase [Nitrospirota bacterium]